MTVQTSCGIPMEKKTLEKYLRSLVDRFFKILPIRENGDKTLVVYMDSLLVELLGCESLVLSVHNDAIFVQLVSILKYLIDNPTEDCSVFKREVFKAIGLCNKLSSRYSDQKGMEG